MMYKCEHCPKLFTSKSKLNRHIARMHPETHSEPHTKGKKHKTPDTIVNQPFKLQSTEGDADTFECGNCHAKLEGEVDICPVCGIGLRWE